MAQMPRYYKVVNGKFAGQEYAFSLEPMMDDPAFDTLNQISSAWFQKEMYFMERDGYVYSRLTQSRITLQEAIDEFITHINS